MPRRNNIKWRQTDEKELKRLVKNFNSKISRILKKDPGLAQYLPKRVSITEIKNNITTRQDFNRELNSLNRFTNRGSENLVSSKTGLTLTRWEKNEVAIQVATINRQRTIKRKQLESENVTSRGQALNQTRSQMNSIRMNELNKKIFNFDSIKKSDWNKFKSSVFRQSRPNFQNEADENLRENYIKGLIEIFGDNDETQQLIDNINKKDIRDFIKTFYKEQEATIDFIYDPIEADRKKEILKKDVWSDK